MYFLAFVLRGPRITDMSETMNRPKFCSLNTIIHENKPELLKEIIKFWAESGKVQHETVPFPGSESKDAQRILEGMRGTYKSLLD